MDIFKKIRRFFFGEPKKFTEEDIRGILQRHRDEARSRVICGDSPCLEDDQLKAWSNGSFPKRVSREQVSEHLLGCRKCSARLDQLRREAGWHPDKPIPLK